MTKRDRLENWGKRYGISYEHVLKLIRMASKYHDMGVKECNGDRHPNCPYGSKSECAEQWSKDLDKYGDKFVEYALSIGFEGVDFSSGLAPNLIKGDEKFIMIPC